MVRFVIAKLVHKGVVILRLCQIKKRELDNRFTLHVMQIILFADKFYKMSNIVDVVVADKNLATMLKGVKAAGLETDLSKEGPFTVFAPSEMAFGKMAQGELAELLKPENKANLTLVLNNHVVTGKKNYKDFINGQKLKTVGGKELDVKVTDGNVTVNGSVIQGRDMEASNGVVHSMNAVINIQ